MCVYICPCWDQCVDEKGINVMAFFTVTHVREQAETKTELEVKGKVIKITFHHILERALLHHEWSGKTTAGADFSQLNFDLKVVCHWITPSCGSLKQINCL